MTQQQLVNEWEVLYANVNSAFIAVQAFGHNLGITHPRGLLSGQQYQTAARFANPVDVRRTSGGSNRSRSRSRARTRAKTTGGITTGTMR
jgi:hypothetical protein